MTRPLIRIHNAETNEVIDREMNNEEFAKYQELEQAEANRLIEAEAKAAAKSELLEKLGISEDEAKLLLS